VPANDIIAKIGGPDRLLGADRERRGAFPQEADAEVQMQLALDAQENAQLLTQALDEHERVTQGRLRKHRIPL
jgi:hypothetical protein